MPNMGVPSGMSVYKGVLVQWDEDQDIRILTWIDSLPEHVREELVAAQEHEGTLGLRWARYIPSEIPGEVSCEGDEWPVENEILG